jgi:hypothetical protein
MSVPSNDLLTLLARTPATVRTILEDLPEHLLHASAGGGGSSPFIALAHLIQGEIDHWIQSQERDESPEIVECAQRIDLTQDHSLDEMLTQFSNLREKTLVAFSSLLEGGKDLDADCTRQGLREGNLEELLATCAVNDLTHIAQIVRTIAAQFDDDVGPWKQYKPILEPRIEVASNLLGQRDDAIVDGLHN